MKYLPFVLLMLSASALRGQSDEPAGTLTIYTQFAQPPSGLSIGHMKTELDAIMLPFHRRFNWRSLEHADGREAVAEIMVVSFKGDCRSDTLPRGRLSGALGLTHISDGAILPFADVDCDQIRELMASVFSNAPSALRESLLGRAMARVLAHEMYHFLAHTTKHASSGIAKAAYSGAELASACLRFDEAQLRTVRAETARYPGEAQSWPEATF